MFSRQCIVAVFVVTFAALPSALPVNDFKPATGLGSLSTPKGVGYGQDPARHFDKYPEFISTYALSQYFPQLKQHVVPAPVGWTPAYQLELPRVKPVETGEVQSRIGERELWTAGLITCAGVALTATNAKKKSYKKVLAHFFPDAGYPGDHIEWDHQLDELEGHWKKLEVDDDDVVEAVILGTDFASQMRLRKWSEMVGTEYLHWINDKTKEFTLGETTRAAYDKLEEKVEKLAGKKPTMEIHPWEHLLYPDNSIYISPRNVIWVEGERVVGPPGSEDDDSPDHEDPPPGFKFDPSFPLLHLFNKNKDDKVD